MTIYRLRWCEFYFISTHILTKRMTLDIFRKWTGHSISTHILTKRMTCTFSSSNSSGLSFQLTSSRRGWPGQLDSPQFVQTFQLTSSRRGWLPLICVKCYRNSISTHILTKRMTTAIYVPVTYKIFQLTSSRRGWLRAGNCENLSRVFQLTSSRRGWLMQVWWKKSEVIFQLTSSRRGWPVWTIPFDCIDTFQLTSSRRGWRKAWYN